MQQGIPRLAAALLAALGILSAAGCEGNIGDVEPIAVVTARLSVKADGSQVTAGANRARISGDGRFVAFLSGATDLVEGDINGKIDVFVKDRLTGGVELASVPENTPQEAGDSFLWDISSSGRFVVYGVQPGGVGNSMLFVRDRVLRTTRPVVEQVPALTNNVERGAISDDGRWVAWVTFSNNVTGFTNAPQSLQLFLSDMSTNPPGLTLISATTPLGTVGANANSFDPDITPDGAYVVFDSQATNLQGLGTDAPGDVYRWRRSDGALVVASISPAGPEANVFCGHPTVSDDGNVVAFEVAPTAIGNMPNIWIAARDISAGTTTAVFLDPPCGGLCFSSEPRLSGNGRYVVWWTGSSSPLGPANGSTHVYRYDLQTLSVTRVSLNSLGEMGIGGSASPAVSGSGSWVAWHSSAANLVEDDTNGIFDVFVRGPLP